LERERAEFADRVFEEIENNIKKNRSFYKIKAAKKINQSNTSIQNHKAASRDDRATTDTSQPRLKNALNSIEFPLKKIGTTSGVSIGFKNSHIDLNNLLKKAGYKTNQQTANIPFLHNSGKKDGSSSRDCTNPNPTVHKNPNLLLMKIPGSTTTIGGSSNANLANIAQMFGPKHSSPKGASSKNVFLHHQPLKDGGLVKLKTAKSPKRKVADNSKISKEKTSTLASSTTGGFPQNTTSIKQAPPLHSALVKILFANKQLSKILKQSQLGLGLDKQNQREKKTKNVGSSSSQIRDQPASAKAHQVDHFKASAIQGQVISSRLKRTNPTKL